MLLRFLALLCLSVPIFTFAGSSLSGRAVDSSGRGLPLIEIYLGENNLQTLTNDEGHFEFTDLPTGTYTLKANAADYVLTTPKSVQVEDQVKTGVDLVLSPRLKTEVTLTVTGRARAASEVSQAVDVLSDSELDRLRRVSLGDTLASRPGISSTSFGTTVGRPIIRGMGGDRIRVLEGGLGTGDVSTTSVDHVISVDMEGLTQVEVLRGPASLRYGGSALGGVVNMQDNRIPTASMDGKITGSLELNGDTVAQRRGGRLHLNGGNSSWAWQVNTTAAKTDDYSIPGPAERFPDHDEALTDTLSDSAMDLRKSGVGVSYNGERGTFGVAYTDYRNQYGVPGHEHHHHHHKNDDDHHEGEEEGVEIDLVQHRLDLRGNLMFETAAIQELRFNLAGTDYAHDEAEGDHIGTRFSNEYLEGRLEASTGAWGFFDQGDLGIHITQRDFSAVGEEAFVAPNVTEGQGLFVTQEKEGDNWNLMMGARYDRRRNEGSVTIIEHDHDDDHHDDDHDDDDDHHDDDHDDDHHDDDHHDEPETNFYDRKFHMYSAALGLTLGTQSTYGFAANLTHTERAPTAESLFAMGTHIATGTFEIGDPGLEKEISQGLDVEVRKQKGRIKGKLSLFFMDFENYIYERFTGEEVDGLRETAFTQADSETYGGEMSIQAALLSEGDHDLDLQLTYDQVRAQLDDGTSLPRITPRRIGASLAWHFKRFQAHGEVLRVEAQSRVAPEETMSDAYTLAHLSMSFHLSSGALNHQLLFQLRNLTDTEARVHTSYLKDRVLQPGRNLAFSYRMMF